ncbi:MAG: hypothetical protein LBP59_19755 [Planctomycetaceae bacterium]|jgi:hypothetical protein|nr:hypothetical protein [Planctomycetaceae bacterium]
MNIINVFSGNLAVNYRTSPSCESNQTPSKQTAQTTTTKPATVQPQDDFIAGDEKQLVNRFTYYLPTTGNVINYRTGTVKPSYIAVTTVIPDAPENVNIDKPQQLVTADQFDANQPGAVLENGHWSPVNDFVTKNITKEKTPITTESNLPKQNLTESNKSILSTTPSIAITSNGTNNWKGIYIYSDGITFVGNVPKNNNAAQWIFPKGNETFENHEIVNVINTNIDNYGYKFNVPGYTISQQPNGATMLEGQIFNVDGELITSIQSQDRSNYLQGLTLEERDLFWNTAQEIFNQHGIKINARKENYGYSSSDSIASCGKGEPSEFGNWYWISETSDDQFVRAVNETLKENSVLNQLSKKMENVQNGKIPDDTLAQQYEIKIQDSLGNPLDNNMILITAKNGNSIKMTVEQFKPLTRLTITQLLR